MYGEFNARTAGRVRSQLDPALCPGAVLIEGLSGGGRLPVSADVLVCEIDSAVISRKLEGMTDYGDASAFCANALRFSDFAGSLNDRLQQTGFPSNSLF